MKAKNPMESEKTRKKVSDTLKRTGHKPPVRGGNGMGLTVPQEMLLTALGTGWVAEFAIPTKKARDSGYPTCYKVDLANPKRRIAVEVDGNSHHPLKRQAEDRKQDALLESLGWKVLRFWNAEILQDVKAVSKVVLSTI
ncbi:MAG: DUF559 domain-containing protein [Planctomycetota bacterium]